VRSGVSGPGAALRLLLAHQPHQDAMLFVYSQLFGVDEFVFDPLDIVVIEVERSLRAR